MKKIRTAFFYICCVAFVLLLILAIINYPKYGRGISYYLLYIGPLLFVGIGLLSALTAKWWIALLVVIIALLGYLNPTSGENFQSVVPIVISYSIVSLIIGLNCRCIAKEKQQKNTSQKRK